MLCSSAVGAWTRCASACKGIRDSTPARRHAGCGQAARTTKGTSRQALLSRRKPREAGVSIQSSECVAFETEEYRARLKGCRFATASEYYRSNYSSCPKDATRCSSSINNASCNVCGHMVERNRLDLGRFPTIDRFDQCLGGEYRCLQATTRSAGFERMPDIFAQARKLIFDGRHIRLWRAATRSRGWHATPRAG
jgi:hypothetical protein